MFGKNYFYQLILLFNIFLLLFMGFTTVFSTINESYYTISANFYFYLQYFHQKVFQLQQSKQIPNKHLEKAHQINKIKRCTSSAHGGWAYKHNSANWLISTFLGRNMTSLEAISFAVLKREYLHTYMSEQHDVNTSLQKGKKKILI